MTVREGKKYCGEHMIVAGEAEADGRKRIACPLDKKHTVFEDQLEKHLKKCNQTKKTLVVYYSANINSGITNYEFSPAEEVSLNSVSKDKVSRLIEKVKEFFKADVSIIPHEALSHSVFQKELSEMADKPAILKHLKQQASLIGHMDKLHLLESKTVFAEFGAGRGKLSHWLQMAMGNSAEDVNYLLIDRANNRYKFDRYHRGEDQGPSFQRLKLDIEHLDLSKVPCIKNNEKQKIVAISKHLCGAATDLTLRCLMETLTTKGKSQGSTEEKTADDRENKRLKLAPDEGPVKGIILALCCHHCCSWPKYVGRPFLQKLGFTAEDFHLLCCLSSWATCGIRVKERFRGNDALSVKDTASDSYADWDSDNEESHETATDKASTKASVPESDEQMREESSRGLDDDRWSDYTVSEREEIGRQCKRVIDTGRLRYLESHDFTARLAFYVDSSLSLENAVLLAAPKT